MNQRISRATNSPRDGEVSRFGKRALVAVAIAAFVFVGLFLLWRTLDAALALFAGFLLAILLDTLARWIGEHTPLSRRATLFLTLGIFLLLILLAGWFFLPSLADQTAQLASQLQSSSEALREELAQRSWGDMLLRQVPDMQQVTGNATAIFSRLSTIFSRTLDIFTYAIIILFTGIYLAYEPRLYIDGLLKLAPKDRRARLREVIQETATSLRWWLVARLASMVIVGILSIIGLFLLGVPLAFILGVLAGLLAFIPLLGPTLALIPPLLIALTQSPQLALYVFLLYMGIQFVESYVLTPVIERRAVSLPPVLIIVTQVLMGIFAGLLGIMVASPLAVVGMVAIKMLYVEDVLGDETVSYVSEAHGSKKEGEQHQAAVRSSQPS